MFPYHPSLKLIPSEKSLRFAQQLLSPEPKWLFWWGSTQILLYPFKKKFSFSVILKERHLPFTLSTNMHAHVQNDRPEACSFPFCRKSNCSDFLSDFSNKKCFIYTHPQKNKYDNQALMKHLTACKTIKGITQRQLYIQNVSQILSRTRGKGTHKYYGEYIYKKILYSTSILAPLLNEYILFQKRKHSANSE